MTLDVAFRFSNPDDLPALEGLYRAAFAEEDLVPLLHQLLNHGDDVLSLVALSDGEVVGHVAFTRCEVEPGGAPAALLGPLCAAPSRQKQGIGGRLVREGLERIAVWHPAAALVLGDPGYYARFGFEPGCKLAPPYELPAEWAPAWQVLGLQQGAPELTGTLAVPGPWQDQALWSS